MTTTNENLRNEIRNALCDVAFKPRHYRIISEGVAYALGKIEYPAGAEAIVREEAEAELETMAETRTILEDMRETLPKDRDTRADLLAVAQRIGRAAYPFCYEVGEAKAAVGAMAHYHEADLYEHRLKMSEAPSVVLEGGALLASNRAQSTLRHLLRYMEGGEAWHLPKAWLSARETLEAAHDGEALRDRMRALDLAVVGALPEWLRHDMGMDTPPVMNVVQADAQQPAPQRGFGLHWARVAPGTTWQELHREMWMLKARAEHELDEARSELDALRAGHAAAVKDYSAMLQEERGRAADAEQDRARLNGELASLRFLYREAQDALRDAKSDKRVVEKEAARLREAIEGAIEAKNYMERLGILRRALATGGSAGAHEADKRVEELEKEVARLSERPSPGMVENIIHEAKMDQFRRRIADLAAALETNPEGMPGDWHQLIGKVRDLRRAEKRLVLLREKFSRLSDAIVARRESPEQYADTLSDEAYRIRLLIACPEGAAYTAEDIGNLSGEKLDGIGTMLGVYRA